MNLGVCLLVIGTLVATTAPRVLAGRADLRRTPRLGVVLWLVALVGIVVAWGVGATLLLADALRTIIGSTAGSVLCNGPLAVLCARPMDLTPARATVAITIAAGGAAAVILVRHMIRVGGWLLRARRAHNDHLDMLRLLGRPAPGLGEGAVVLDAPERAVYCVSGGTVVVTTGALKALTGAELAAVLAHERAHLRGRHHVVLAMVRAFATAVPAPALFSTAKAEIGTLLEMAADDTAARRHSRRALLSALLTMVGGPIPSAALGAADTATLERATRLAHADPTPSRRRLATAATAALPVALPLLTVAAMVATCSA